ncbi:MAG TPA: GDP-mannose 4,6-dehydratase [Bacteroidales bacterium]|nr:GDP-mannose 4,6-dehydratase [Bacteroidales bacterium]
MRRVLVTGAAGFIGSHLVDALLEDGWWVDGIDNFDPYYNVAIKHQNIDAHLKHPHYRLYTYDIRDREALMHLEGGYDVIVHMAAKAGVRPSIADPNGYQDVNVRGTQNILELARKWKTRQFVFASSSSVYGLNNALPWKEDACVLKPVSPYASTKVSGELLGHVYSQLFGIRFIALRFFTVYGPRQRPDLAIHKFSHCITEGRPLPLFGTGNTQRDYTYVDDIVHGVRNAMIYDKSDYEIINLGNHHMVSLLELVHLLEETFQRKAILDFQSEVKGDLPRTWADIDKARDLLGYRPHTPIGAGLQQFRDWFNKQDNNRP